MSVLCRFLRHRPERERARHDGDYYWCRCKRCGVDLLRDRGGWRTANAREAARHAANLEEIGRLTARYPAAWTAKA